MNFRTSCGCQMRHIFISQVTWTSRTIITRHTATLKKFMNTLYTAARWQYGVQFHHTGSLDLTFSKMKSGSQWLPLQISMLRCCNLLLHLHWKIFHNFTKPGFNRMVRHSTLQGNQWQLCENCSVNKASQDSVTFPGHQVHQIYTFVIFSCGATLRIGSTRLGQGHWKNWNKESKTKFIVSLQRCCSEQWGTSTADWKNAYVQDAIYRT